jgi:hypothetical protein
MRTGIQTYGKCCCAFLALSLIGIAGCGPTSPLDADGTAIQAPGQPAEQVVSPANGDALDEEAPEAAAPSDTEDAEVAAAEDEQAPQAAAPDEIEDADAAAPDDEEETPIEPPGEPIAAPEDEAVSASPDLSAALHLEVGNKLIALRERSGRRPRRGRRTVTDTEITLCGTDSLSIHVTRTGRRRSVSKDLTGTWSAIVNGGSEFLLINIDTATDPADLGARLIVLTRDAAGGFLFDGKVPTRFESAANCVLSAP